MSANPYTPGAGSFPPYLAGRSAIVEEATEIIMSLSEGIYSRSLIFYGLRGVGKTVLINHLQDIATKFHVLNMFLEAPESGKFRTKFSDALRTLVHTVSFKQKVSDSLKELISTISSFHATWSPETQEIKFGIEPSLQGAHFAGSGDFQLDVMEVFMSMGAAAKDGGFGIGIFLDELQYMQNEDLEAIIMAIHRCNQKGYPIILFCAGLPSLLQILGDIKSYTERLFQYIPIGALRREDAIDALTKPAEKCNVQYTDDATRVVMNVTDGYPYFIQEFGRVVWPYAENGTITQGKTQVALPIFRDTLDNSFYKIRYNRATPLEREFMYAMSHCEILPCSISDVARHMKRTQKSISPLRAQLIHKGLIYSAGHGIIDFTVPQFDGFLKRVAEVAEV